MKLNNLFKGAKQALKSIADKFTTKKTLPKHTGTQYQPLPVFKSVSTKKKHPLHKHHFGNFKPIYDIWTGERIN